MCWEGTLLKVGSGEVGDTMAHLQGRRYPRAHVCVGEGRGDIPGPMCRGGGSFQVPCLGGGGVER